MRERIIRLTIIGAMLFALLARFSIAQADNAPPSPSGGSISPGDETTRVQMQTERVVVDFRAPWSDGVKANVTAIYTMRNQGEQEEQLDVRFPLTNPYGVGDGDYERIQDLTVTVNGRRAGTEVETIQAGEAGNVDWAVFEVSFPAAEDVLIEVNYIQEPRDPEAVTAYPYIFVTGGGWYDVIARAELILRLPYTANTENVILDWSTPGGAFVENEVRWMWENMEPEDPVVDDWEVYLVQPQTWQALLTVQEDLVSGPYNAGLWLGLGDAYRLSLEASRGLRDDPAGIHLQALCEQAYLEAVALDPQSLPAQRSLVSWYWAQVSSDLPESAVDERLQPLLQALSAGMALDENDDVFLYVLSELETNYPDFVLLPPGVTPTAQPSPTPKNTPIPTYTPVVSATPTVSNTPVPSPTVTSTRLASPTPSPTIFHPVPSPTSTTLVGLEAPLIGGVVILALVASGLAIYLLGYWMGWRRRGSHLRSQ
ncbi:MAG: hypothetical protein JW726_05265 [Anaerolineales bacterium]|nr:hypothetical protein [Anaerolineales bacterium]